MTGESATGAETAFVDWTRRNAVPLKTVEAGNGFADMAGIGKIVGDARIVALGEATHGSREFFQLKHRIIEYLATQKNFTVFAIEANMPEAYRLNDYVLHGEGNPKQLLKGMYFWTWNTQEVLDLVLWMREYNRSGKGHVEFTGFDMQNPKLAMEIVQNFIAQQEPSYAGEVAQSYADVMQAVRGGSDANASKEKVAARCAAIVKHLEDRRATYEKQASPRDVEWATQMARIVCQATQMATGEKSRDASMSENVQWIAEQSRGGKLILWAHNGHITYEGYSYDSMGSHLRKIFGDKIVNFGFKFNEGSFRAYGTDHKLQVFTIGPAPDGSLDHALASTGLPVFALDVRKLPGSGTVGMWAAKSRLSRSIGAVYSGPDDPSSLVESPVHCMFDVLLFVDKTTAARAN
jgi:erythromycin esterase